MPKLKTFISIKHFFNEAGGEKPAKHKKVFVQQGKRGWHQVCRCTSQSRGQGIALATEPQHQHFPSWNVGHSARWIAFSWKGVSQRSYEHQTSLPSSITSYGASCTMTLQAQACSCTRGRNPVDVEVRDLMTRKPPNTGQKLLIKPAISLLFRQTNKAELKEMHISSKLVSPDLVLSGNQDCCQAVSQAVISCYYQPWFKNTVLWHSCKTKLSSLYTSRDKKKKNCHIVSVR